MSLKPVSTQKTWVTSQFRSDLGLPKRFKEDLRGVMADNGPRKMVSLAWVTAAPS